MPSPPPPSRPYSLQLAERIHRTTGKDSLARICAGGFLCESLWHSVFERKILKTSEPIVKKAMFRALVFWPSLYLGMGATLTWAEWRVKRAGRAEREDESTW